MAIMCAVLDFLRFKMGRLDNHDITALCGSSGEDENSGWSIYVDELKARDANYKMVEKSQKKAIKKRRRVKKDLEDDIQAAEGTVLAQALQND